MKTLFIILSIITSCMISTGAIAQTSDIKVQDGVKYRIVHTKTATGAISIGEKHNSNIIVYYLPSNEGLTSDSYWFIDKVDSVNYLIRNAETNQCLSYTPAKDYTTYERLILVSKEKADANAYWALSKSEGSIQFVNNSTSEKQYIQISSSSSVVKADKYSGSGAEFILIDENGLKVDVPGGNSGTSGNDGGTTKPVSTTFSAYADSLSFNNRRVYYDSYAKIWLSTIPPTSGDGKIDITFLKKSDNCDLKILEGEKEINKVSELEARKEYTLRLTTEKGVIINSTLYFTTLPLVDIHYDGTIKKDMDYYVLGNVNISSIDHNETLSVPARFKIRGATASNWPKHSMNMKFRETETDAEIDTMLLGLRKASSWILDAMSIDRIKMRNRVCFDIWNEFSKLPYATDFSNRNGTLGKFVEVIENGKYVGIYCLTDRINRKLLNLKKPSINPTTGEVGIKGLLYKSNSWDYTDFSVSNINTYENIFGDTRDSVAWCNWEIQEPEDYPSVEAWQPLYNLYTYFSTLSPTLEKDAESMFYLDNVSSWHLFALTMCLTDNGNKNCFLSVKNITKEGNDKKYVFTPWDMDASLGGRYDGLYFDGDYENIRIADTRINKSAPFSIFWSALPSYRELMAKKWFENKKKVFSEENISTKLKNYASLFISSGAWDREISHWPKYNQLVSDLNGEINQILDWYRNRIVQLDEYFKPYYNTTNIQSTENGNIELDNSNKNVYDLSGRQVTNSFNEKNKDLAPGIYIIGKRKIVIK